MIFFFLFSTYLILFSWLVLFLVRRHVFVLRGVVFFMFWLGDCGFGVCGYAIFIKISKISNFIFFKEFSLFQGDRPSPALQGCMLARIRGVLSPSPPELGLLLGAVVISQSCPPASGLPGFPGPPPQLKKEHWVLPPFLPAVPQFRIPLYTVLWGNSRFSPPFVSWTFVVFLSFCSLTFNVLNIVGSYTLVQTLAVQVEGKLRLFHLFTETSLQRGQREAK